MSETGAAPGLRRAARDILIGAVLLIMMCIASGRPQIFSDTKAYYVLGQEIVGFLTPAAEQAPTVEALRGRALAPAEAEAETRIAYTVAASRSPYWSVLFYLAATLGTAWFVVALQALVAATTVWVAVRAFGVSSGFLPIIAALALLTSLPVSVMFLMPDLFAGLAILAAAVLVSARDRLTRAELVLLWGVMAAGALFHTSHVLILLGLGTGILLLSLLWRRQRATAWAGAAVMAAAALGLVGALTFPATVRLIRGEAVYAPPFISARLIADGPGRALLQEDCRNGDVWGWCPYLSRPLVDVNTILWDPRSSAASFQAADYDRRVRIIQEQSRFALAVISRYPVDVAASTARNVAGLFMQYGTHEMLGDPSAVYRDPEFGVLSRIVPGTDACARGRASCASRLNLDVLDRVFGIALLLAWLLMAFLLATERNRRQLWLRAGLTILAGLVLNAVICGAISGNAERYQARLAWIVPLLALAMATDRWQRHRRIG
jgi:hypothetical protein